MTSQPGVEAIRAVRGSFAFGLQSIANAVLGLVFFLALARALRPDEMGIFAGLEFILAVFSIGGSSFAVVGAYILPRVEQGDESRELASLIGTSSIILAGALAALVLCQSKSLSELVFRSGDYRGLFRILGPAIFLATSGAAFDGILQGLKRYGALSAFRVIGQLLRVGSGVVLLALGYGVVAAVIALMANGVAMLALGLLSVRPKRWRVHSLRIGRGLLPYWASMVGALFVVFLSGSLDLFVVVLLRPLGESGVFRVASVASTILTGFVLAPMAGVLLPAFSTLHANKDNLSTSLATASRYHALVFVPAAIGLAAASAPAINLFAGEAYSDAGTPLALLSLGLILFAFVSPVLVALQAGGFGFRYFAVYSLGVMADLLVVIMLVPVLGMYGAAVARISLFVVVTAGALLAARNVLQLGFDWGAWKNALASGAIMGTVIYLQWFLVRSVAALVPMVISGIVVYAAALKLLHAIKAKDVALLQAGFSGRFGKLVTLLASKLL